MLTNSLTAVPQPPPWQPSQCQQQTEDLYLVGSPLDRPNVKTTPLLAASNGARMTAFAVKMPLHYPLGVLKDTFAAHSCRSVRHLAYGADRPL
jgi:hypothetical protein